MKKTGTYLEALLIACNQYEDYESSKPAIDMRRMNNFLKESSFTCIQMLNPTLSDIQAELRKAHKDMPSKSESVYIIYFSGKGVVSKDPNTSNLTQLIHENGNLEEFDIIE